MKWNKILKNLSMVLIAVILVNVGGTIFATEANYNNYAFDLIPEVKILEKSDNYIKGVFEIDDKKIEFTEKRLALGITELNTVEDGIPHHVIIDSNSQSFVYDGEFFSVKDSSLEINQFTEEVKNEINPLWSETTVKRGSVSVERKKEQTITHIAAAIMAAVPGGLAASLFLEVALIWRDEHPYDDCYFVKKTTRTTDGAGIYPYVDKIKITFYENSNYTGFIDSVETLEWPLLP